MLWKLEPWQWACIAVRHGKGPSVAARLFDERARAYLAALPAVAHVAAMRITYTEEFQIECVRRYLAGRALRDFAET